MIDMQEGRRLLAMLEKAIMDYCECYQPVMMVEKSEEKSKILDDALDKVRERLANWPATRALDIGHGRTVEGTPYVIEDLARTLKRLPELEQRLSEVTVRHEEASKRAHYAEEQNRDLRRDLDTLRGYVQRMVDERRAAEPRFPQLLSEANRGRAEWGMKGSMVDTFHQDPRNW